MDMLSRFHSGMPRLSSLKFSRYLRMDFKNILNKIRRQNVAECLIRYLRLCTILVAHAHIVGKLEMWGHYLSLILINPEVCFATTIHCSNSNDIRTMPQVQKLIDYFLLKLWAKTLYKVKTLKW